MQGAISKVMKSYHSGLNKLSINTAAIIDNYKAIKKFLGKKSTIANLKADAYGLGAAKIMPHLSKEGCNKFFVSTLTEAINLRNLSLTDEIYVLKGIFAGEEEYFSQNNIIPVLNNKQQYDIYNNYCKRKAKSFFAVLNVDTGFNLLGIGYKELQECLLDQRLSIRFILTYTQEFSPEEIQLELIKSLKESTKLPVLVTDGFGKCVKQNFHLDIVEMTLGLFGCLEVPNLELINAITLTSKIVDIKSLENGKKVGIIPIGYADGIPGSLANKGVFDLNGYEVKILGDIAMDFIMLDVGDVPHYLLKLGEEVEILGKYSPIQRVINETGKTCAHIITSLSDRIDRIYK